MPPNPTSPAPVQTPRPAAVGRSAAQPPVRAQHPASLSGAGEIKYIRVDPRLLEPGDVVLQTPHSGALELVVQSIVATSFSQVTALCTNRKQPDLPAQQHRFTLLTMETLIAGPKLEQARANPALVRKDTRGWLWLGEETKAVV